MAKKKNTEIKNALLETSQAIFMNTVDVSRLDNDSTLPVLLVDALIEVEGLIRAAETPEERFQLINSWVGKIALTFLMHSYIKDQEHIDLEEVTRIKNYCLERLNSFNYYIESEFYAQKLEEEANAAKSMKTRRAEEKSRRGYNLVKRSWTVEGHTRTLASGETIYVEPYVVERMVRDRTSPM